MNKNQKRRCASLTADRCIIRLEVHPVDSLLVAFGCVCPDVRSPRSFPGVSKQALGVLDLPLADGGVVADLLAVYGDTPLEARLQEESERL